MIPASRRTAIKDYIIEKKSITVTELSGIFNVTDETIRKDLKFLEEQGVLVKTYGGAFIQEGTLNDINVSVRVDNYKENKALIAQEAIKLINNGDSVIFDSSTTTYQIAMAAKDKRISVVTNSLLIGNCLVPNENIKLFSIGGELSRTHMCFFGKDTENTIKKYYADKAFVSCRSLDIEHGITDSNDDIAEIRRIILNHAKEIYLVVDHTKFNKASFVKVGNFEQITGLITDQPLDEQWLDFLNSKKIKVFVPENGI